MREFIFQSESEADTTRLGAALAEATPDGAVIALDGTLGAGKTRLVQALAAAVGVPAGVTSPTFVLFQEYRGRRVVRHLDAYRLRDEDEFTELGIDELWDEPGITLIEWAERVAQVLPHERLRVRIDVTGAMSRKFTLTAHGSRFETALDHLGQLLTHTS